MMIENATLCLLLLALDTIFDVEASGALALLWKNEKRDIPSLSQKGIFD